MENLFKSVINPNIPKIFAVGKNYMKHVKEMGGDEFPKDPLIFTKPFNSLNPNNAPIILPAHQREIHHEIELGFIISKAGKNIPQSEAFNHVGGYFLALDLTDRDLQASFKKKGWPWDLSKGFDGSMPISGFIQKEKVLDPNNLELLLKINQKVIQNDITEKMYYKIPKIIEYVSSFNTLVPGDLFITGTPSGVGPFKHNDKIEALLLQNGEELASIKTVCIQDNPKL